MIIDEVIATLLAVFLIFTGPLYNTFKEIDTVADTYTKNAVSYFQKEVRKDGYVDKKTYSKFLTELSKSGRVYKIELKHSSKLVYPQDGGDYKVCFIDYGTKQILKAAENDKYKMKYGDDFSIKVTETNIAPSRLLVSMLAGTNNTTKLTFIGGGMVENEVVD